MTETTAQIIEQFDQAFQTHDPSVLESIIGDDCVLENTGPAPDGATYTGKAACVSFWTSIAANPDMHLTQKMLIFWVSGQL